MNIRNAINPAPGRTRLLASVLGLGLIVSAFGQSGLPDRWSNPATWGGQVPGPGQVVTIPKGKTVFLDTATAPLGGLRIEGALVADDVDVAITSNYVLVAGGRLQIGTASTPHTRSARITLTGTATSDLPGTAGMGQKLLGVMGGVLDLHGVGGKSWTKLGADVPAGARTITLVEPPGWKAGDRILLATSSRNMNEYDLAVVASVSGSTVTLRDPLKFRHLGALRTVGTHVIDMRAEVALLNRNVVVEGDAASEALKIGGHAMFMNGMCPMTANAGCQCEVEARYATVRISGAEFRRMGQLNVTGRYPIHFHLMGDSQGSYVRNTTVHSSIQRGIVLHDVQNVELTGNVVFNTVGHNFVVETEATVNNTLRGNLALINRQASPLQTNRTFVEQNDRMPANYWFKSGKNIVDGNHAAGSFNNGFVYDGINADPIHFTNNVAHASMGLEGLGEGAFDLLAAVLIVSGEERPSTDVVSDTLVYHNSIGMWPEEVGTFNIVRLVSVDNDIHTENRGVSNRVAYRDSLFVGRMTEPRERPGDAVHFQYGSDVLLDGVTFANFEGGLVASMTDIALPVQANLWIRNARYIGPRPQQPADESLIVTCLDDTMLPRGTYLFFPQHAPPGAVRTTVFDGESFLPALRSTFRPGYMELDVRVRSAVRTRTNLRNFIRRSDGLRYRDGMFGYTVLMNANVTYALETVSTSGYALRLSNDAYYDSTVDHAHANLEVAIPVAAAPRAVHRTNSDFAVPGAVTTSNRLRAATSLADYQANPLTSYWFDSANRRVLVRANLRWIVLVP